MMTTQPIKIAITGAAGQIGYALLFRLASGQVFGLQQKIDLHLLELPAAMGTLEGVVMELQDCAFPLLNNIVYTSELKEAMNGINWALLVGSVPRKLGMERKDLLQINGGIFAEQGQAINNYAAPDVRVFVVGNPCNTNSLIAMHSAPDIPRNRFYAMTKLDENRARTQLALKANVPVASVTDLAIWGNHSATQFPDYTNSKINGKPTTDVITDQAWLQDTFIATVQQRGAAVIKARGSSSAASAANAALGTVHDLITETTPNDCYSVAKCSEGEYGIPEGLIFSYPCVTRNGQCQVVPNLTHNEFAKQKIAITTKELQEEYDTVKSLGLVR
jgi:malate dehydrogenase